MRSSKAPTSAFAPRDPEICLPTPEVGTEDLPTCIAKFIPLHTPAVTMSMNAVIGDVTNRNRPGSGFVPIEA